MTTAKVVLVPEGEYLIQIERNVFLREPDGNTLTVDEVIARSREGVVQDTLTDMTWQDFLRDFALGRFVNLTNLPGPSN